MGPVTRSSRRNQTRTKNVLADKTNIPRMSKINENKGKKCLFSHNVDEDSVHEGSEIYEFICTNSPPRKVVKKRKPQHKKKPLSKSDDEIVFPIKKLENICYNTRQGQAISSYRETRVKSVSSVPTPLDKGKTISSFSKNRVKSVNSISTPLDKENIIVDEKENTHSKENEENNSAVRDINKYVLNKAAAKLLDTNAPHGSCVSAHDIQQDVACIITDSENKENYFDTDFRQSFGFSPIQYENRDFYVTKRRKEKRYCVEDFTIENYFGFHEEPDDEVKSPENRSVLYPMSSTPSNQNKLTRPNVQMSQILLSNKTSNLPTTNKKGINKDKICVESIAAFSLSLEKNNSAYTQNTHCDMTSTTFLEGTSTKLPEITSTKTQQIISTKIPQVTSTAISNKSPVLFGDNLEEQHFNKPPRRSYERKARTYWESQIEADSVSEDEICNTERNKSSKKRKVKEDKNFTKWAANVSAEFEEVESFQLYVE